MFTEQEYKELLTPQENQMRLMQKTIDDQKAIIDSLQIQISLLLKKIPKEVKR